MDFLTALPYLAIVLLVIINAIIVSKLDINVSDEDEILID